MAYDKKYGKYCDHTVLRAYTTQEMVADFCDEAIKYDAASVCVNPTHVPFVHERLKGTSIATCCVIGFPLGANKPETKAFETSQAVRDGADELDMVINVGALRDGNIVFVLEDIKGVVKAAEGRPVKVIIETCYLTDDEKRIASRLCEEAGAAYVKTSTGFGTRGATVEDLILIRETVSSHMKIKASTDINTREDADRLIAAGAVRLGVSRTPQIVEDDTTLITATVRNKAPKG
ncbi:MAG: deoxyribose-phosphate aldolase [Eubacteriales bacterium]|nr:deoxyribose-phosphate aldolase [Eubacteriales bacterium]